MKHICRFSRWMLTNKHQTSQESFKKNKNLLTSVMKAFPKTFSAEISKNSSKSFAIQIEVTGKLKQSHSMYTNHTDMKVFMFRWYPWLMIKNDRELAIFIPSQGIETARGFPDHWPAFRIFDELLRLKYWYSLTWRLCYLIERTYICMFIRAPNVLPE